MTWTRLLGYETIYIEAPQREAEIIFYNRFGHSPSQVTCECCGGEYTVDEYESLEQATAYHRGCRCEGDKYVEEPSVSGFISVYRTLDAYLTDPAVLVIRASEIKPEERIGEVPTQGYVWHD